MGSRDRRPGQGVRALGSAGVELVINELAADQAALRTVLQSFLLRLFALRADVSSAAFTEFRDHVLRSIAAIPLAPDDELGGARWKKLVAASAEQFLGEVSDSLDASAVMGLAARRAPGRVTRPTPDSAGRYRPR